MTIALMPHQVIGVAWMLSHEQGHNKGGVMADEMGLGKVLYCQYECDIPTHRLLPYADGADVSEFRFLHINGALTKNRISLMVVHPPQDFVTKTSLVVVPVALLGQWKEEIEMKTDGRFKVLTYYGKLFFGQSQCI
jgi:SNF2 family DNA or RNA helicase